MKINKDEVRTELQSDVTFERLALIHTRCGLNGSYQASLIVHRTFEPRMMQ